MENQACRTQCVARTELPIAQCASTPITVGVPRGAGKACFIPQHNTLAPSLTDIFAVRQVHVFQPCVALDVAHQSHHAHALAPQRGRAPQRALHLLHDGCMCGAARQSVPKPWMRVRVACRGALNVGPAGAYAACT
eukprot:358307-Chlamydomonas_euryale.AAC.9